MTPKAILKLFYPKILTVLVLNRPDSIFPSGLEVSMMYEFELKIKIAEFEVLFQMLTK